MIFHKITWSENRLRRSLSRCPRTWGNPGRRQGVGLELQNPWWLQALHLSELSKPPPLTACLRPQVPRLPDTAPTKSGQQGCLMGASKQKFSLRMWRNTAALCPYSKHLIPILFGLRSDYELMTRRPRPAHSEETQGGQPAPERGRVEGGAAGGRHSLAKRKTTALKKAEARQP